MKPRVVIVGAGLGGCVLAHALIATHDVTLVERGSSAIDPRFPVRDVGWPAVTDPHVGSGLGGTTQLWHNGLIEIDDEIFPAHWPIPKSALDPYYERAFTLLSGLPIRRIHEAIDGLRQKYREIGFPAELKLQGLFYPRSTINVWESLALEGRVKLVRGDIADFEVTETGAIASVIAVDGDESHRVSGDVFVLAAGGLGSPVLLQKLATRLPLEALEHAGCHYEDHPMGFVGELEVKLPLFRLWNFHVPGTGGNLRMPFVIKRNGLHISFQLRPAATYSRSSRRERVGSVVTQLRNALWNPLNYVRLLAYWDDILDILSFKFGIRLPTKHYTLLMVAQMPTGAQRSIWSEHDPERGRDVRIRDWQLTEAYQDDLRAAIADALERLAPVVKTSRVFPAWRNAIQTCAHHSGTARMSSSAESGVCDVDCKVHGLSNLFVCDGSVIPASGIANTGLTIAALALRLAQYLRHSVREVADHGAPSQQPEILDPASQFKQQHHTFTNRAVFQS